MKAQLMILAGLLFSSTVWAGPIDQSIDGILQDYFKIQKALASDSTTGIGEAAQSIYRKASSIRTTDPQIQKLLAQVTTASRDFQASDLEKARDGFFELSKPLLVYLNQSYERKDHYYRYFCSMKQRAWIQPDEGVRNPYAGQAMPTCGELIK